MNALVEKITEINNVVNTWIWTDFGLYLLLAAGVIMTAVTGVFQLTHLRHWWTNTIVTVFKRIIHPRKRRTKSLLLSFRHFVQL